MALNLTRNFENGALIAVWKLEEPEPFFLERLRLEPFEQAELEGIKGHRRLERLASRHLLFELQKMAGGIFPPERIPIWKDEFGKPHFLAEKNPGGWNISYSHSREMVAAAISPGSVGIDVQHFVSKIATIAPKFMREEELKCLQKATAVEQLHLFWAAKEAMYKAHGRRQLDFRQHIITEPFEYLPGQPGVFKGTVFKDDFFGSYQLAYEQIGEYFLVTGTAVERDF